LRDLGVALGAVVANRVLGERFGDAERKQLTEVLEPDGLAEVLAGAGIDVTATAAGELLDLGRDHLTRLELQRSLRDRLERTLRVPLLELPEVEAKEFGEEQIAILADALEGVL